MADKKGLDSDSATALAVMQEEKDIERIKAKKQVERESLIAESHEIAGRIQAFTFMGKVVTVSSLVQLKKMKDSKIYRDLPNIGTWEEYCKYLGLDRHTVDQDLLNLSSFGENFLETCHQFSLGYRDLRKLRQLTHDGSITVDAEAINIKDERIPLDADHKEDLQAAIETIIAEQAEVKAEMTAQKKAFDRVQDDTRKSMTKLQKDLDKFSKLAEGRGMTDDEDAFCQRMEAHRIMIVGSLIALEPEELAKEFPKLTNRMRATVISLVLNLKMQVLALADTVVTEIGNSTMNPEVIEDYEKWLDEYHKGDEKILPNQGE
jgi:DNA-directed RNA polymerase beta subunit